MESQMTFDFEKETKNYWRYKQAGSGINTLYVTKSANGSPPPKVIVATLEIGK